MPSWLAPLENLLHTWWPVMLGASVLMLVISALMIPWFILRLPADHFSSPPEIDQRSPAIRHSIWLARNLVALVLLTAGILMLVLPGQGMLTIFIALVIAGFPGKHQLQNRIARNPAVFKGINWIRKRYHRTPFIHPDTSKKQANPKQAPLS